MKKSNKSAPAADSLPTFLDEVATDDSTTTGLETATMVAGDEAAPDGSEPTTTADDSTAPEPTSDTTATAPPTAPAPAYERPLRRSPAARLTGENGAVSTTLGAVAVLSGCVLPLLPALATQLAVFGLSPATLALGGLVLCGVGMQSRRLSRLQQRLAAADAEGATAMANLQQELRGLLAARPAVADDTENREHLLMAMQRQDDKVNNLTKAIKMYGKPLMDIANHGTDLAGSIATVRTLVEGGAEATRQALARMETQLRSSQSSQKQDLGEVNQGMSKLATKLDQVGSQAEAPLAPVQQKLSQLEVALAAISQRLEDSEVRKSLLRLEAVAATDKETLQQLLRGDAVRQASTELQGQLDRATRGISDGLVQLRDNNLGGLETAVRDIQREVSGVATTVAQINAAVKSGARTAAPAAAAPTPSPTPAPTPTSPSAPAAAPAAGAPAGEGGGYQTGARATASKNVLGAIAKLKQMKN